MCMTCFSCSSQISLNQAYQHMLLFGLIKINIVSHSIQLTLILQSIQFQCQGHKNNVSVIMIEGCSHCNHASSMLVALSQLSSLVKFSHSTCIFGMGESFMLIGSCQFKPTCLKKSLLHHPCVIVLTFRVQINIPMVSQTMFSLMSFENEY